MAELRMWNGSAWITVTDEGHLLASNPHPTYATDADLTAHEGAANPHPGYLTPAEGNAAYDALGTSTAGIAA